MDQSERKFLHELSNPLAVGFGNLKILLTKFKGQADSLSPEFVIERLEKMVEAYEKANRMVAGRRTFLRDTEESKGA